MTRRHLAAGLLAALALLLGALARPTIPAAGAQSGGGTTTPPRTAAQRASAKTPLQSLVTAEKLFAALATSKGMREAFLANLAEDGVIFRPLPINGRKSWESRPANKGRLAWEPAFAEVSGSGDFGFTTGPWEYTAPSEGTEPSVSYGNFLSFWRREGHGPWKVVLDAGVSHERPEKGLDAVSFTAGPSHAASTPPDTGKRSPGGVLRLLDGSLSRTAGAMGSARAYAMWASPDIMYLAEGAQPRTGEAAVEALAAAAKRSRWAPTGSAIARSLDLGYTYGVREDSAAATFMPSDSTVYVHVWRLTPDGKWQMAAAIENPLKRR